MHMTIIIAAIAGIDALTYDVCTFAIVSIGFRVYGCKVSHSNSKPQAIAWFFLKIYLLFFMKRLVR